MLRIQRIAVETSKSWWPLEERHRFAWRSCQRLRRGCGFEQQKIETSGWTYSMVVLREVFAKVISDVTWWSVSIALLLQNESPKSPRPKTKSFTIKSHVSVETCLNFHGEVVILFCIPRRHLTPELAVSSFLDKSSVNYGPQDKSDLLPMFIDNILLDHSYFHSVTCLLLLVQQHIWVVAAETKDSQSFSANPTLDQCCSRECSVIMEMGL